ncbi:MAG: YafY family transcriptional regulator [Gammaproteobacteria bacterium]|nr:YafY family transcriptional regulator [Gammaproteobacteria bacterium]
MRRADRLFQILLLLGHGKVTTAQRLATALEISERTVYRDIQDLMACGVPIDGEAGVGYILRSGYQIPPLMFTAEELEALTLGTRVVQSWADKSLGLAADNALAKIEAALPPRLKKNTVEQRLFVPDFHVPPAVTAAMATLRGALHAQRKVGFGYTRADGAPSARQVRPLGLFYWGGKWTLGAWCELRHDFRDFRLDRMHDVQSLVENFRPEPGKTLQDYLRRVCENTPPDQAT